MKAESRRWVRIKNNSSENEASHHFPIVLHIGKNSVSCDRNSDERTSSVFRIRRDLNC